MNMKKLLHSFILPGIILTAFSLSATAQQPPRLKIVIIRHGEKPKTGDNLSCQGLNRALALPPVLYTACGGAPNYTYVPTLNTGKKTSSVRMFQTVTPFAVKYNLTINSKYAETDTVKAAADVVKKNGVVLMVWEHGNIPGLARNILGDPTRALSWAGHDFDSLWTIEFPADGSAPVLTFGQEGLKPKADCK
jgi:hypothetical protein